MPKARFGDYHMPLPASRAVRITLGVLLIVFGLFGFLPIVGFWMIPLGLIVLSVDLPVVRRWRRQLTVWWHRPKGAATAQSPVLPQDTSAGQPSPTPSSAERAQN